MFDNISETIKDLAEILLWCGIIVCVFLGLAVCIVYQMVAIGLLIMLFGSALTYVISLLIYGYGHMIERIECMEDDTNEIKWKMRVSTNSLNYDKNKTDD